MGAVSGFAGGFGAAVRGVGWMLRRRSLARYWLTPLLLTLLVFVVTQGVAWAYADDLLAWFGAAPPDAEAACGTAALSLACLRSLGGRVGYGVLAILAWLCAALIAAGVTFLASMVLAAPFNDALSEAVERQRGGQAAAPFSGSAVLRDAVGSLALELGKLTLFVLVMAPLALASWLVPGVGPLAYGLVGGAFSAVFFALDFTDWPAARRGWGLRRRVRLLRDHPAQMLGFGAGVWMLLCVPLVNVLLVPAAVIGGTLLFLDLEPRLAGRGEKP